MNLSRISAVARKEWREIRRDRIFAALGFLLPILLMLEFGYGPSHDVENVPFAIVDHDRTAASRDLAARFIDSRYFRFKGYLDDDRQPAALLAGGSVRAVLVIPEKFEELTLSGRTAQVQTILDGAYTTAARTTRGYVEAISAQASVDLQVRFMAKRYGVPMDRAAALTQPVRLEVRYLYNQEIRTLWALAPALIMFILSLVCPLLPALGVVRERETGSIYNIYSTTITRAEYLAGKLLPYVAISYINTVALWLMAVYLFRAPFKGSLLCFLVSALFYVICLTSVGMLLSLLSKTQQAAMFITIMSTMIVVGQFSGMWTPISSMEPANQAIARMLPPMYFNDIIEGSFLKGLGFADLWPQMLTSACFAALGMICGWLSFHKRVRA